MAKNLDHQTREWLEHASPTREILPHVVGDAQPFYCTCQWVTSRERPWVFCPKPTGLGGVYCESHRMRATAQRHVGPPSKPGAGAKA